MDNQSLTQSKLEGLSNSTPLRIDVFSVKEFDSSTPLPLKREERKDYFSIFLRFFALGFAIFLMFVFLNFNKAKGLRFVKDSLLITPEVRNAVDRLGESVENYYNFLLGKENYSNKYLLRLDIDGFMSDLSGVVAGAKVERRALLGLGYQPSLYFLKLQEDLEKKEKDQSSQVLGENIFFSEQLDKLLREGKELSVKIIDNSKTAQVKLEEYEEFLKEEDPKVDEQEIKLLLSEIKEVNEKARTFISQAEKTGNYYYLIYDINIELAPQLINYIELVKKIAASPSPSFYLTQLDDFQYNLLKLQGRLKRVSSEDLPFGLEDLHNDNLKIFDLLNENVKEIKAALAESNKEKIVYSLAKLNSSLQPIYERSKTLEINFWQNNRSLRRYREIVERYSQIEQRINSYLIKNRSFLLEYLSQLVG